MLQWRFHNSSGRLLHLFSLWPDPKSGQIFRNLRSPGYFYCFFNPFLKCPKRNFVREKYHKWFLFFGWFLVVSLLQCCSGLFTIAVAVFYIFFHFAQIQSLDRNLEASKVREISTAFKSIF